jgi:hypothetical protein
MCWLKELSELSHGLDLDTPFDCHGCGWDSRLAIADFIVTRLTGAIS